MFTQLKDIIFNGFTAANREKAIVFSLWPCVAGEKINKITSPYFFRNGILYVHTTSSAWACQLNLLKTNIMKSLNSQLGRELIIDIRFKLKTPWDSYENKNLDNTASILKDINIDNKIVEKIDVMLKELDDNEKLKNILKKVLINQEKLAVIEKKK